MRRPMITAWCPAIAVIISANCVSADSGVAANTNRDSVLFQESFAGTEIDLTRIWHVEGQGRAQIDEGRLALQDTGAGVVLWVRQDFPSNVRVQLDLSFSNNRGIGVFFVAARGIEGEDILIDQPKRSGDYSQYTSGIINCYGFSLHRFFPDGKHNAGTNIRKNSGFHQVNHVENDPVQKANQTYCVQIEKVGGQLRLWVDGHLIHDWKDDETHGATLKGGKIGFRVRGHRSCIMYLDNIVINSPQRTIEPPVEPDK
ncbi:MAG: YesU family protein [Ignavibacteria bacterium]|nr:YesU family protein [Ignavibacteria bacterium]